MSIPMTRNRPAERTRPRRSVVYPLLTLSCRALARLTVGARTLRDKLQLQRGARYLFHPLPDDVFVASFPKSGTTLLQMMLYQLTTPGNMDFPHLDSVSPWFEFSILRDQLKNLQVPSPRIYKTHLLYGQLPRGPRYIYLVRDVRDVAVSAYHHSLLVGGQDLDLTWYLDRFLAGKTIFGSWFEHLESWWPHRQDGDVLFLRFEDVVADLEGAARRVAEFCGFEIREAELPRILEGCSLGFMKRHEAKFDPRLTRASRQPVAFIRKGQPGEGKDIFNPARQQLLAAKLARLEEKVGASAQDLIPDPLSLHHATPSNRPSLQ